MPEKKQDPFYLRERTKLQSLYRDGVPIIAISKYARSLLKTDLGVEPKKVIYHGLLDMFRTSKIKSLNKTPRILFCSRLVEYKKPFDFLEALAQLPQSLNYVGVIKGDGPLKGKLAAFIKQRDLQGKVTFAQHIPFHSMPAFYDSFDIFVHTCPTEGFGLAILEAMGRGLPVIVPAEGGAIEVVGEAGLSFSPGNTAELADELLRLISDNATFQKYSQKSISRSSAFTWENAASEYMRLYVSVSEMSPF